MTLSAPSLGVVITSYGPPTFLAEALQSVTAQTVPVSTVVVVEDGTTEAADIVARFPSVEYYWQPNAGVAAARNAGLARTDCDYVLFLDGDDRLLPAALEVGLRALAAAPEAGMASSRCRIIDDEGQYREFQPELHPAVTSDHYRELLRATWIVPPSTVLFRRSALAGPAAWVEDRALSSADDYEIYLRVARSGAVVDQDVVTVDYRVHANSTSRDAAPLLAAIVAVLEREKVHTAGDPELERARLAGLASFRRDLGLRAAVQQTRAAVHARSIGDSARAVVTLLARVLRHPRVFVRMVRAHSSG